MQQACPDTANYKGGVQQLQPPGHPCSSTASAAIDMDWAGAIGLELGMFLSSDEDEVEEVLPPPARANTSSAEHHSELPTAVGIASCIDALSTTHGEEEVEEDAEDDSAAAQPAAPQPAARSRGRRTKLVMQILSEGKAAAAAAASQGGQQQPAKRSRDDICAGARAAKRAKRPPLLTETHVPQARARQCFSPEQHAALKNIIYSPTAGGGSAAVTASLLNVSRTWLPNVHLACAEEMIVQDERAFHTMLLELHRLQKAGVVEPMQFTLFRMYDETPEKFRTLTASGSSVEADCCTAKVLACQREWCMLFAHQGSTFQSTAVGESSAPPAGFGVHDRSDDPGIEYTTVFGGLTTSLVPMQNQTAELLLTATERMAWLPPDCQALVEELFPRRTLVSTTDMHGSNVRAEYAMANQLAADCIQPPAPFAAEPHCRHHARAKHSRGWNCVQVRCEMHRSHSCELRTHDLVAATVSGVLNVGLSLRIPGIAGCFRRALRLYISEPGRLVILHGKPPREAIVWRKAISYLFTRLPTRQSRTRAAVIGRLCNGDWQKIDRLEHYCPPGCCPKGPAQTLDKFCRHLVPALTKRLPMIFPRRKWIGSDESLDDCGWLLACHGILLKLFEEATSPAGTHTAHPPPARGPQPRPAATAAAPQAPAARIRAPPPAVQLQEPGSSHQQPDSTAPLPAAALPATALPAAALAAAEPPAAEPPAAAPPAAAAEVEAQSREDNAIKRASAMGFLDDEPLAHIVLLRIVLEPFRTLKARLLECSSAAWRERQLSPIIGQRVYPLTRSWHADEAEDSLVDLTSVMFKPSAWDALGDRKQLDGLWAVNAFRLLARAGAGILELLIAEQRVYPYKLFATLDQPDLCDDVASDFAERPCMFDPVSASICSDHASAVELCSPAARSKIMSIAELVQTSTAKVECGHAAVRRRARGQVQTHAPSLAIHSAHRAIARGRRLVSEAWPTRSGLQHLPGVTDSDPGQPAVQPEPPGRGSGGGGCRRAHCHEAKVPFSQAGVTYRSLPPDEVVRLKKIGTYATQLHRSGVRHPFGQRVRKGSNREAKALGRRKQLVRLAHAKWDRDSELAAVRADFDNRNDLMGAAIAVDKTNTKTALQSEQALLQRLRQHATAMSAVSTPGLCSPDDMFEEPGGLLVPARRTAPDREADSDSDCQAVSQAPPPAAICNSQRLRSQWHLPRRLESVEAAVLALGVGAGSGVVAHGVAWEARHTVITGAECPKIGRLPPVSLCQRAGRCICRDAGSDRAAVYRSIQAVLKAFVVKAGALA